MSTADAVAREAAWLEISNDTLPALVGTNDGNNTRTGGPWDVVQAYWPGARLRQQARGIYVSVRPVGYVRASNQRLRAQYEFTLTCVWPVKQTTPPVAEGEQQALADAIDLVFQRVNGLLGDKTHGGRFLSVGEVRHPVSTPGDPAVTIPDGKQLTEVMTYTADDLEING